MMLFVTKRQPHERSRRFEVRRLLIRGQPSKCLLNHAEGGFTLVETLGAFTALTLVLIVLLAGLSGAVRGSRHADAMRDALRLAQSKLDSLGVTEPLTPGESTGRFGNGFEWHLRIREVRKGGNIHLIGAAAELTVSAAADGSRLPPAVSLVTIKLAGAPHR
jgi:type II secretory pathway pseudopilin PulG